MSGKINKNTQPQRREYDHEFKRQAVQMPVDGHSAASIVEGLGISGTICFIAGDSSRLAKLAPSPAHWIIASENLLFEPRSRKFRDRA